MKSPSRAAIVFVGFLASLCACGRSSPHNSSSVSSAEEAMLTEGVSANVYWHATPTLGGAPGGGNAYYHCDCIQMNVCDAPRAATFDIERPDGTRSFIDAIPVQISETILWSALVQLSRIGDNSIALGGSDTSAFVCYSTDNLHWTPGNFNGVEILVGAIKVTAISLVNEFPAQGPTGPTQERSYHVAYIIERPSGAAHLPGIDGVTFVETCVLIRDNVENRWSLDKCTPTNGG